MERITRMPNGSNDCLHGVWVKQTRYPNNRPGRIAYTEGGGAWIVWEPIQSMGMHARPTASYERFRDLKVLPVEPEPWYHKIGDDSGTRTEG